MDPKREVPVTWYLSFAFAKGVTMEVKKYIYDGPVLEFGKVIAYRWRSETTASSEKKARNNLAYKYKINNNRVAGAKITLPGKITVIG